ncbi:protein kinase [Sorangium cellulosum]|uniref:serine/threonine-protein kinase n=1 Tax=Sorangium cellulosum TaxID=56 RepID=UPI003D9A6AA5
MSIAAGQVLSERYRLIRPVGQGAQASVWVAEHLALSTHVAVKLIDPDLAKQEDARERFRREATAAAQLRSAHVVQVLDHGIEGEQPFIVMELLEGEDLFERLARRRRLSLQETSKIVTQVARALTRAHGAGIVHRDLKPENFFLCANEDDEVVKILDFGIAKVGHGKRAAQRTTVGTLMGTPHYMSPEQVKGLREVDYRADLWALGVIVYQCVTGELPFDSEGVGDLLIKISVGEIPVPSRVNPELPPTFDAWFARACDRDPEGRFSSARDLAESLARIADLSTEAPSSLSSPRPPPLPPRSAPTRPPAAPPRPATGSTIPKAPPLPRMADPGGDLGAGSSDRRPSERSAAAAPLSTLPSAKIPARPSERPPAPPRLTDRPPAPPALGERPPLSERAPLSSRLGERPPAPPRLTDRPPAPPRPTERPAAPPRLTERPAAQAQLGEQPPTSSPLAERLPLGEAPPLSSRRGERPPLPPRRGDAAALTATPISTGAPLARTTPPSAKAPLTASPSDAQPGDTQPLSAKPPPSGARPATAPPSGARPATAPPSGARPATAPPSGARPATAPPSGARPATAPPSGARPATADGSLEVPQGSTPLPRSGAPRPPADSAPSLVDVDIEDFEEDAIDTDVDEPWVEPSAPAALAPQAATALASPAPAALAPQAATDTAEAAVLAPQAATNTAEAAEAAPQSGEAFALVVPAASAAAAPPPPQAPALQGGDPTEAASVRGAPPGQALPEERRDDVEPAAVGAAALSAAPPAALRAPQPLEPPIARAPVPPERAPVPLERAPVPLERAARAGQTPEHWMRGSTVNGMAHEGELPEFDPGSRRRRLARWGALVLVVLAGVAVWQVVRLRLPPLGAPAAEGEPAPPAVATEPAPPQEPAPPPSDTAPAASAAPAAPTAQPSASAAATSTAPRKRRPPPPPPKRPRKQPATKVDDLTIEIPDPVPEPAEAEPTSPPDLPPPSEPPPPEAPTQAE